MSNKTCCCLFGFYFCITAVDYCILSQLVVCSLLFRRHV